MRYLVNVENVESVIAQAASAARIAAPRGPWRDTEYRRTFADFDVDRITGALGWVLSAAGVRSRQGRRLVAQLSNRDDGLTYHLWPRVEVDGLALIEPDLRVMRALDAACVTESELLIPAR